MALVRVNEQGRRIGESHRNARHSDEDVERAIAAYEVLQSYAKVAAAMGAKKSTVRDWIKVGAGLVEWIPNPHGDGVVPVPKSISYTAMEEGEMREFHENCMDFLRTERAQATLWPHAKPSTRELWMDTLLDEFTPDWERA